MVEVEVVERVRAAPDDVWRVYSDHVGWTGWAGIGEVRLDAEGHPERDGVGAVRSIGMLGVRVREEILAFERPRRMRYRVVGGLPLRNHLGEVEFEPEGDGTRITWRCHFEVPVPGLGWLSGAIVSRVFRHVLRRMARRHFR